MTIETAIYSAYRGYAWSRTPPGLTLRKLKQLYRLISIARGDFPDPLSVDVGLVSDGEIVAAFTIQNVDKWGAEKRSSEYAAVAFFSVQQAGDIDFVELLNHDFFWTPSREPATSIDYDGPASQPAPKSAVRTLHAHQACLLPDPRTIGAILKHGAKKKRTWTCLMMAENVLKVECQNVTPAKGA